MGDSSGEKATMLRTEGIGGSGVSRDYAVFFEGKVVHCLVYGLLDFLPVRPSLDELVDVLELPKRSRPHVFEEMFTSGRYAPPYRVTSLTICAKSFASSTT